MTELEQLKQELEEALEKVKAYEWQEKEKKEEKKEFPNIGQVYYYMEIRLTTPYVVKEIWHNFPIDISRWVHCYGAYTRAEVEWTIKHISLISEIKKHTRPFSIYGEGGNLYLARKGLKGGLAKVEIDQEYWFDFGSEYNYFDNEEEANKIIEEFGEDYILKFLFPPIDGNYKSVMNGATEQEEE